MQLRDAREVKCAGVEASSPLTQEEVVFNRKLRIGSLDSKLPKEKNPWRRNLSAKKENTMNDFPRSPPIKVRP